jgi:hypothetical protein
MGGIPEGRGTGLIVRTASEETRQVADPADHQLTDEAVEALAKLLVEALARKGADDGR